MNSSQEIFQKVPGLLISQHTGAGKAEQIFLRDFDIDHRTNITILIDGMLVNMLSHDMVKAMIICILLYLKRQKK